MCKKEKRGDRTMAYKGLTEEEARLIDLMREHPENISAALRVLKQEAPADENLRSHGEKDPA